MRMATYYDLEASTVFLDGVDPSKYDDDLKTMKEIEKQSKDIVRQSAVLYPGSSYVGTLFKKEQNKTKSWYDNNSNELKYIIIILVNIDIDSENNMVNQGVDFVSGKTSSDTVKQMANAAGNMAKSTVEDVAHKIQGNNYSTIVVLGTIFLISIRRQP